MPTILPEHGRIVAAMLLMAVGGPALAQDKTAAPVTGTPVEAPPKAGTEKAPDGKEAPGTADEAKKEQKTTPLAAQVIVKPTANAADGRHWFVIRNDTAAPMTVSGMTVIDAFVLAGGRKDALQPSNVTLNCGKLTEAVALPVAIEAFTSCTARIDLRTDGPGRYEAKVLVQGAPGAGAEVPLFSDIKLERKHAILWIVFGLIVGGFVSWWTSGGRGEWSAAASVKAAMEAIARLDRNPAAPLRLAALAAAAEDLQSRVLAGETYAAEEITELQNRVRYARFFLIREQQAGASDEVRTATAKAIAKLDAGADGRVLPAIPIADVNAAGDSITAARPAAAVTGGIEAAAPRGVAGMTISAATSSAAIRRQSAGFEVVVAALVAVLFAAIALPAIYDNAPHWGSFGDQLAAFLIGFGAFAGSMAGVTAFLAGAKAKPA